MSPSAAEAPIRRRVRFGVWTWVAITLIGAAVFYTVALSLDWPFTKQALINTLQERSLQRVTVDRFRSTYFPPGCIAEGIRFIRSKHKDNRPVIAIQRLVIEDRYPELLTFQHRLTTVRVIGLHVSVPPGELRGRPGAIMPLSYSKSGTSMPIGALFANGAILDLPSNGPDQRPFRIRVQTLALYNVASSTPMNYSITLNNSDLPGEIHSTGLWGPWNPGRPGTTPVSGKYDYRNANLAAFPAVSGTLNSSGKFQGRLSHIDARGSLDISNFQVKDTSHRRRLAARYDAVIDGTNGDVILKQVSTEFDRTTLLFNGSVASQKVEKGKAVSLDVSSNRARVEDLLDLFISSERAPMTGDISLHGHIGLPPGATPFVERLNVQGGFEVTRSQFADAQTERELARLSVSAIKGDKEEDRENPQTVPADLSAQVNASHGIAHLSHVLFKMPGAVASLDGTFSLTDYRSNLYGTLATKGDVSDATSGAKSLIVKIITPFFHKKQHEKIVPFKITGPYGKTSVSLNPGSKRKPQSG